jgi:hypothetical protein
MSALHNTLESIYDTHLPTITVPPPHLLDGLWWATRLRKGDDKGLTEYTNVLPESIQPSQSKTSLRRSVK